MPALKARALGIIEELCEFLVDLDHGQQLRQAGAEAPNAAMLPRGRHVPPEERRASHREPEHPIENAEENGGDNPIGVYDVMCGQDETGAAPSVSSTIRLAFALAAEITDLVRGVAIGRSRQCDVQLHIDTRRVLGIAS